MARCFVGVSGWRYSSWRGDFYPTGLRQKDELTFIASKINSVEINGSFYSLQRPTSYQRWATETPDGFLFAVKGGRYITHLKQLRGVEQPLANFFASGVLALGGKLGPVLWQLPPRLRFTPDVVDEFLSLLPRTHAEAAALAAGHDDKLVTDRVLTTICAGVDPQLPIRHALEPRHTSFDSPEARSMLQRHRVATVIADSAGTWPTMTDATADFRYVRLHGESELYASGYSADSLDRWAGQCHAWLTEGHDVFVYFDNDARGHAPHDAVALAGRLGPR